jgi:hypothetical protein
MTAGESTQEAGSTHSSVETRVEVVPVGRASVELGEELSGDLDIEWVRHAIDERGQPSSGEGLEHGREGCGVVRDDCRSECLGVDRSEPRSEFLLGLMVGLRRPDRLELVDRLAECGGRDGSIAAADGGTGYPIEG